jgi:hypothetical protein
MPSAIIFSSAAICRRLNDLWQTFCQNWKFAGKLNFFEHRMKNGIILKNRIVDLKKNS